MHYLHVAHPDIELLKALFLTTFTEADGVDEGKSVSELVATILSTTAPEKVEVYIATDADVQAAIIFTELTTSTGHKSYLLSPVAVVTEQQGKGIGQALITFAREELVKQGAEILFTYGDPAFYSKVGFNVLDNSVTVAPQPLSHPHGWLGLSLCTLDLTQQPMTMQAVAAFDDPAIW